MTHARTLLAFGLITLFSVSVPGSLAAGLRPAPRQTPAVSDTDRVVHDLCSKTVALLGEPPMHGYGRTLEFKVELVRRLVDECHYNAFFIESGVYDFVNIQKKLTSGQPITQDVIAAAIGGIWANREVEPLIPFLFERAQRGALVLGGLDDQLGRGTYAQHEMPADLVESLQGDEKARCLSILQRHTLWQYSNEAPYSPKDKALIVGCLDRIETSLSKTPLRDAPSREGDIVMVESLKRLFARDFRDDEPGGRAADVRDFNERDQSMYRNFQWLMSRLPAHSKVIVWAATNHVAKDLSGVPGDEGMVSMGSYIRRAFKGNAFAVGSTTYSGSYAMAGRPAQKLSVAAIDSLEGKVLRRRHNRFRYALLQLEPASSVRRHPGSPPGARLQDREVG